MLSLEDFGEQGFLDKVAGWVKTRNPSVKVGIGDDAVVLSGGVVVSSDSYEESVHFSRIYFGPADIGFKSAGATISDLAGMGAEPVCLLVNLFASGDTQLDYVRKIYQGIEEACEPISCEIAGGDTVSSEKLILSCTALGRTRKPILRSGARPGDHLYVSGYPGLSVVGQRIFCMRTRIKDYESAKQRHLRPAPRIQLGLELAGKVSGGLDCSDGISTDAGRLAQASAVQLVIEHQLLPRHPEVARFTSKYGGNWDSLVLNGGEDYELLFTSKQDYPDQLAGVPIHRIGRIEKGEGAFLEIDGELKPLQPRGWDHFSA